MRVRNQIPGWGVRRWRALAAALRDRRGNVAVITAILLPVLLGGFGVGFETANWYQIQRDMQNAADSAAIAAASNASSNYDAEAKAVTASYGFTNGSGGVTVTDTNAAACPAGGNTCYKVTISQPVQLYLIQLLGFHGNTTLNNKYAELISTSATATVTTTTRNYCLFALAGSGAAGITGNGVPFANLQGCDVMSNTSATCNGHNLNAGHGDAHTTSIGCGYAQDSNVPVLADPYAALATNIPPVPNTCKSPATEDKHGNGAPNTISGAYTWGATQFFCGDVQLTGDTTITSASPGTVIEIADGRLDTNGYKLQSLAGSGVTIIFTAAPGDFSNSTYTHGPTGGGTLDISSPQTGTWKGVAMYQDPNLTAGVDLTAAGNSPTWEISGLVYLPHSSVTFSGAVNKSSNGYSCFDLVVDNVTINGTGSILDEGQCTQQGLIQPNAQVPSRGALVQ